MIAEADTEIVTAVSNMTNDNIKELRQKLNKINSTLLSLGIQEQQLITKANQYSNPIVNVVFSPITFDSNVDTKYKKIANDLEMWAGLSKLAQVLPLGAPVKNTRVTSSFGVRKDPFTHKPKQHKGIDFAGKIGTELSAVAPGRVISVGERSGYGLTVEIDHGLGFSTLYAHLSKILVSRGDWIRAGTVVGLGGSSGRSTGAHLHYEIKYKGNQFTQRGYYADRGRKFTTSIPKKYTAYLSWLAGNMPTITDNITNLASIYGTASYSYKQYFTINANTRYDGSNRFGDRSNEKILPVW
jgi:murein DD-endopeptidase MepM/ murein hydrolase activator NlpD